MINWYNIILKKKKKKEKEKQKKDLNHRNKLKKINITNINTSWTVKMGIPQEKEERQ